MVIMMITVIMVMMVIMVKSGNIGNNGKNGYNGYNGNNGNNGINGNNGNNGDNGKHDIIIIPSASPWSEHTGVKNKYPPTEERKSEIFFSDQDMHRKTRLQRTIISCYHFYVMVMSMAVSVHASATDWILTDGLINLSSTNKDQRFEFHNRRTFTIFHSRFKLIV